MSLIRRILRRSVNELTRAACVLALVALAIMVASVVYPKPLVVILAMSVGHGIGAAALGCYVLAVIVEASRSSAATSASHQPGEGETRSSDV